MIDKVLFIIMDPYDNILETVFEQEDIKSTTETLSLRVTQQLMFNGNNELIVRYVQNDNRLQMHVYKHPASVDDGKITFPEYIIQRCRDLVTSMYRKRDLDLAQSAIETNE